jgi:hypothetical protein
LKSIYEYAAEYWERLAKEDQDDFKRTVFQRRAKHCQKLNKIHGRAGTSDRIKDASHY